MIKKESKPNIADIHQSSRPILDPNSFQMIVDNLPEGVLVVDSFNDILFANSTALSYLETPEKDIIGKNIGFGPVPGAIKTILLPKSIDPARQCFEACFRNLYWNGEASYLITLRPHENGKPTSILAGKSEIMDALPTIERSEECQLRFSPQGLILDALDISPGIFIKDPGSENNLSIFDVLSDEHSQLLKGKIELLSAYQPMQIFNAPYAYGLQSNQHLQFILQGFFDKSGEIYEYLLLGSLVNSFFPYSKESSVMTSIVDHASQPIAFTDMNGNFTHANQQFFNLLGYRSQDIYGKQINSILSSVHTPEYFNKIVTSIFQRGGWQGECWLQHKNQHIFPAEVQATTIFHKNGEVACCAIYICDKSELRLVENNLRHLALHDPLTNLPNRTLLLERLYQSIRMANKKEEQFAVLHLDLDGFKAVNNTYGHIAGDQLLKLISERLLTCIHKDDLLARMGGDEFAIISYPTEYMGLLPASVTAQKIINDLTRPCLIEENELFITASIGISLYPEDGTNATSLLKNADIAMYRAKELGKNNFQFYSEELNRRVLKRLDMGNHLRHALERDEFRLVYQPIVESHSRRIVAAEALLRWEHTQLGRIMPDDFISLAEETGLIVDIGKWVIQTACKQHMVLLQSGYSPVQMSVNISGRQLEQDDFVSFIEHTLANTEMKPDRLVLEITESFLMEDIEKNRKKLVEIRKLGVKISIDDFGTGYSSLNSLVNLPIDSLKIDKTFVDAMEENPHGLSLVKGVISIGHNLDMEIIAEGVEHNAQAILLETHGCDQLQGYYFGMPMNFNELCRLIDPLL